MPESSVDKYVRKSSLKKHKQYQKEGWKQFSTDESLLSQIEKAFAMELELDQNGEAKYISKTIMATDKSLEVARMKAIELAKMRIASIIGEEIDASINLAIENEQKDNEGIKSSSRFVTTAKARAFHKLGHIEPVIECWRERADKSLEVHMIVMYEVNEIDRFAKDIINKNTYE